MEIKGNEQKFIFSKRIEFTSDDGTVEFVEVREFNMEEMKQFQKACAIKQNGERVEVEDWSAGLEKAETLFAGCVVSSSFTYDGNPASGKQVYELLKKNSTLFNAILSKWLEPSGNDSPFQLVKQNDLK